MFNRRGTRLLGGSRQVTYISVTDVFPVSSSGAGGGTVAGIVFVFRHKDFPSLNLVDLKFVSLGRETTN